MDTSVSGVLNVLKIRESQMLLDAPMMSGCHIIPAGKPTWNEGKGGKLSAKAGELRHSTFQGQAGIPARK